MKARMIFICVLIALCGLTSRAQTNSARSMLPVIGVWRANAEGSPFVTLDIAEADGALTGAVLFYLHRADPGQEVKSTPGIPEPLIHVTLDGAMLSFQVNHRRAHPAGSLPDPPVHFQIKLTGPDTGTLIREKDESATIQLTRSDY